MTDYTKPSSASQPQKNTSLSIDDLPPAIRKAARESGRCDAADIAARLLKKGMSEADVLERLKSSFDPLSADIEPNSGKRAK